MIRTALVLACMSGTLWAADHSFVGKWRVDPSKSTLIDQMKVAAVGPNKYAFTFEGTDAETIVVDGTDQPGLAGTVLSVTARALIRGRSSGSETGTLSSSGPGTSPRTARRSEMPLGQSSATVQYSRWTTSTSGLRGHQGSPAHGKVRLEKRTRKCNLKSGRTKRMV